MVLTDKIYLDTFLKYFDTCDAYLVHQPSFHPFVTGQSVEYVLFLDALLF